MTRITPPSLTPEQRERFYRDVESDGDPNLARRSTRVRGGTPAWAEEWRARMAGMARVVEHWESDT